MKGNGLIIYFDSNYNEFNSWQELLCFNFAIRNVFSSNSKEYFSNCCRVCNSFLRDYLVKVNFIEVMDFIESFQFRYFTQNEFNLLKKRCEKWNI